jgi:hypothetical protein
VSSLSLFGWLPGRRGVARQKRHARRGALAGLEFALAELGHELRRLAELSSPGDHDDGAAVARETTITARILEVLARGERFASQLPDSELVSAWRQLAASAGRARLLGQGPHRVAKLQAASAECERLQQLVGQKLADQGELSDEHRRGP